MANDDSTTDLLPIYERDGKQETVVVSGRNSDWHATVQLVKIATFTGNGIWVATLLPLVLN